MMLSFLLNGQKAPRLLQRVLCQTVLVLWPTVRRPGRRGGSSRRRTALDRFLWSGDLSGFAVVGVLVSLSAWHALACSDVYAGSGEAVPTDTATVSTALAAQKSASQRSPTKKAAAKKPTAKKPKSPSRKSQKPSSAAGRQSPESALSLERIFQSAEFRPKTVSARWLPDGNSYTTVRSGADIIRHDAETGAESTMVSSIELTPDIETPPLQIQNYSFSSNLSKVLIYTNSKRVWRSNTRGDYWVLDRASGELRKLGAQFPASTLMFAKFSPDAHYVAYVHDRDVYVEDLREPSIRKVTSRRDHRIINGTFDWVYEEELGLRDGFRWSPDSRSIAYWQLDTTGVRDFPLVNNTAGLYPTIQFFAYPKVGERNASGRIGVVSLDDEKTRWLPVPGDSRNHYIARMDWVDSTTVWIQQLNRLQNTNRLFLARPDGSEVREVFRDQDSAWVRACDELNWLDSSKEFTWVSERDGWRHVYSVTPDEGPSDPVVRLVTSADFDVIQLLHVDRDRRWLYFIASPEDATCRYLYRQSMDGGEPMRLTAADQTGWHDYNVSPNGRWAVHSWSSTEVVPTTELVRLPDHVTHRSLVDNRQLAAAWAKLKRSPVEFLRLPTADGQEMDAWCMKPPQMEQGKKYPLIVYVYGEPAGSTVTNRWSGGNFLWHQMLAQQGFVVVSMDNRGTKVPRGRAWRKSIYRQVGVIAPQDQAAGVRALLERRNYLDAERVGVWGWSGGGSMTLNALFKYPELYRAGISIAPVPNQRYYDTIYQERYMGLPNDNPVGYRDGSAIHFAENLKGELLLVHGTGDDNCHYQTTELLIDRLIRLDKPFQMMAYPNRTHSIREGTNTTIHLRRLMTKFFGEELR